MYHTLVQILVVNLIHGLIRQSMEQSISLTGVQQTDTHPRMEEPNVIRTGRKLEITTVHPPAVRIVTITMPTVWMTQAMIFKTRKAII